MKMTGRQADRRAGRQAGRQAMNMTGRHELTTYYLRIKHGCRPGYIHRYDLNAVGTHDGNTYLFISRRHFWGITSGI